MSKRLPWVGLLILAIAGVLVGCGGGQATETVAPDDVPVVASEAEGKVVAEAVIEPYRWSELRFDVSGDVVEVLVQEGEMVAAGDVLVRLETGDLERAVARAELDLRRAQLRLEQLREPADPADVRQAEHAVEQAAAALKEAQLGLAAVRDDPILHETLEDAQDIYEDFQHKYEARLAMYERGDMDYYFVDQAQEWRDDAKLNLDRIRKQGDLRVQEALNQVQRAQQAYQEAQGELERLLKGADEQDVEAAELEVAAAELACEEARSNLENTTLRAPFAGVVTKLDVGIGDKVSPGQVVLVLATLDRLEARTVDLVELDVAQVKVGQPAVVKVDALPDVEFAGVVREIALQAEDYRGDVVYAVAVEIAPTDTNDAPLRWGMTAMVEIETDSSP